jgi:UDP-2,3-diacylglucosamine pyrophosphatase LpxH
MLLKHCVISPKNKVNNKQFRTTMISDVHLGSRACQAQKLDHFLKHTSCQTLYLVGDIIDGWKIQQNKWFWRQSHSNVIRRILSHARQGTRVVYVAGNHDEFLRPMIPMGLAFGRVELHNQIEHVSATGQRMLVVHGDMFDGITRLAPWISFLGDRAYDAVIGINTKFNWLRHKLGFGYWSLSKYLKQRVKKAVDFIFKFEKNLVAYCKKREFQGVICGHIHHPEIKDIDQVWYMNTGDWTENCSALLETHQGDWILVVLQGHTWIPVRVLPAHSDQALVDQHSQEWCDLHGIKFPTWQ